MKQYQNALEAYDEGMKLDPSNPEFEEGIQKCLQTMNARERAAQSGDKEVIEEAMKDPEIQQILNGKRELD